MKKLLYLLLPLFGINQFAQAQVELVPLTENPVIRRHLTEQPSELPEKLRNRLITTEKNTCDNLENPDVNYVTTGQTVAVKITIDTTGFGEVNLTCIACQIKPFGDASISGDTLYYTANNFGDYGEDQIQVEYCSQSQPDSCRTLSYRFRVRRAGRTIFPQELTLRAEGMTAPLPFGSDFFNKAGCAPVVLNCADNYDSRGQQNISVLQGNSSYEIVYKAGRYPGIDSVCVVLCDSFAVCDTFKFAFRIQSDTLQLPFMDDFSYFGPYPDASHWLDLDVFVNNDMADTPPSWGVATFDGLNSNGRAYGGGYGIADYLTSKSINLNNIAEPVYLTYWLQRRGFGDRPEVQDSMVLEFKDRNGKWQQMRGVAGALISEPNTVASPFRFYSVLVPNEFKFNSFQFRFRNYSDRTGILDVWHLDYVRMDRNAQDSIFRDVAFTRFPNFILKNYSSMPWWQFKDNEEKELRDSIIVNIWNHAEQPLNASPSTVRLFEINSNKEVFINTLFNGVEANILNGMPIRRSYNLTGDPTGFPNIWLGYLQAMKSSDFENYDRLDFRLEYVLKNTSQNSAEGYKESVDRNDSVRRFTTFDNYFAYDDGTAEAGVIAQPGVEVALKYTLNKPDSLRAIQFHFPRTTVNISDQLFNIKVWVGQLDDTPEYEAQLQRAYYADIYLDTLQGFTTYPLMNANGELTPLELPAGDIYIGWQQETDCDGTRCIPVGYDRNSPNALSNAFRRTSSQWQPFPTNFLPGALMIRPVVGNETPPATSTDEVLKPARNFSLYPNPTREVLNITPNQGWYDDFQYLLFSSAGQQLSAGALQPQLQVGDLPPGIYFIKIADRRTNQMWNERFIIAK